MLTILLLLFASYSMLYLHLTPLVCWDLDSTKLPAGRQVTGTDDVCPVPPLSNIIASEEEEPSWQGEASDTLPSYLTYVESTGHDGGGICSRSSDVEIFKAADENLMSYDSFKYDTDAYANTSIPLPCGLSTDPPVGARHKKYYKRRAVGLYGLYEVYVNDSCTCTAAVKLSDAHYYVPDVSNVVHWYYVNNYEYSTISFDLFCLDWSRYCLDLDLDFPLKFLSGEIPNAPSAYGFNDDGVKYCSGQIPDKSLLSYESYDLISWREESYDLYNRTSAAESSDPVSPHRRIISWRFLLLAACILPSSVIAVAVLLWWWCRRTGRCRCRGNYQQQPNEELGQAAMAPRQYRYREVADATSNFAESGRIGRGGFGAVYRGVLGGLDVAVKVLSPESEAQGRKEFEAEVRIISRLRHRSLVQLFGWCDCRRGLFLVYELVPEGSLDKHLYGPDDDRLLTWTQRYMIVLDLGSAILYLHTECEQCVVHGDIKPSNIMLDSSRRAKLGDFGLARLVDHGAEPQTTQVVAGTVGYIDPELVATRRPSTESDVYSFGVVLLEVACGRRPTAAAPPEPPETPALLLRRVRDMYDRDAVLDAADRRLNGEFDREQMERVLVTGLWCAHRDRGQRPSIAQAMAALRSEGAGLPVLQKQQCGSGETRAIEEQAYGELLPDEAFGSTRSTATAFHTPEDSSYLLAEG